MKTFILALLPLVLTGCTITKQAQVSEASAITGVVRLTYNQAMLQTARTDDYVTQGTATKECQRLGYASVLLDTLNDMEAARALYEELGFTVVWRGMQHSPSMGMAVEKVKMQQAL